MDIKSSRLPRTTSRLRAWSSLAWLLASACGGPASSPATRNASQGEPEPNRAVDTSGGHVAFGFRVTPGADDEYVHVVGVLVGLDGEEHVTDLGEWQGELTITPPEAGELGHIHLEGPVPHEFIAVPVGDSDLDLYIDGERVQRIHYEAGERIRANEPLLLRQPVMRVAPRVGPAGSLDKQTP